MPTLPDFTINPGGPVSKAFLAHELKTFSEAAAFIRHLPYGRNADKSNLLSVFSDNCGTCSTKHALLKQLSDEQGIPGVRLILGIFKMNGNNTPKVAATLNRNGLEYIPEAHNYLGYQGILLDYTNARSSPADFIHDLLEETEIAPEDIGQPKIDLHKKYLDSWLEQNKQIPLTLEELWRIREQCISDLSA